MTLRQNADGEWIMPRGLCSSDMAHEIYDAVNWQEPMIPPDSPPPALTVARNYVKVTGNRGKRTCRAIRRPISG